MPASEPTQSELCLRDALDYAARGWAVFPVHSITVSGECTCGEGDCSSPGKHPRTRRGFRDASKDSAAILAWWKDNPDSNIGIASGSTSGIFVVDIDGEAGNRSWAALTTGREVPATLEAATGGGGRHLVFRMPSRQSIASGAGKLGDNIDIRGDGGYIVAPPSLHASGNFYAWINPDVVPADAPAWLLKELADPPKPVPKPVPATPSRIDNPYARFVFKQVISELDSATEGTRNESLNKKAFRLGQFVGAGMLIESEVVAALREKAITIGLGERETEKTIRSGIESGKLEPAVVPEQSLDELRKKNIQLNHQPAPNEPWPDPKPLPSGLPAVLAFSLAMLPVPVRNWVADIAERMQCPIDYVAATAMIVAGSLIGRTICIRPKRHDDWSVVPNLFGAMIGRPSLMKSPAIQEALKPLDRLEIEAKEEYQKAIAEQSAEEMVAEATLKAIKLRLQKAVRDGEDTEALKAEIVKAAEGSAEPIRRRYRVNDATVEKLGMLLAENPNGLLVYVDELASLLRTMERDGHESDRGFYLCAWAGTSHYTYDRVGRGTVDIQAAIVSIVGSIQPGVIAEYLREAVAGGSGDDGLMQRFQMTVWPDAPTSWQNIDRYPNAAAKDAAFDALRRLAAIVPLESGADFDELDRKAIPFLRFDVEAQAAFDAWRMDLETRLRSGVEHPAIESHLAKYRSLIPSLSLIFHLLGGGRGSVPLSAVTAAIEWGRYLESHARRLYASVTDAPAVSARIMAGRICKGEMATEFAARDVYRMHWSGLDREQTTAAIDVLLSLDWLAERTEQTGGRAKTLYAVNPKVFARLADAA